MSERIKAALAELSAALGEHLSDFQGGLTPNVSFDVRYVECTTVGDEFRILNPVVTMRIERIKDERFTP